MPSARKIRATLPNLPRYRSYFLNILPKRISTLHEFLERFIREMNYLSP